MNAIHKLEKVFDVEIPSRAPHIINNVVQINQNACKETNNGIQKRFKNEIKNYTTPQ